MLRTRLVLATLSGRAVRIRRIRALDQEPGLREAEASLVRLLDKITDGSRVEVSETGTALFFSPGKKPYENDTYVLLCKRLFR